MVQSSDYIPRETGASRGSRGVNVRRLQNYLTRFGYLDSPALRESGVSSALVQPAPDTIGTFDEQTEEALRTFQRFVGLEPTGQLDQATLEKTQQDRCGNLDIARFAASGYVLSGCKWSTTNLRYGFHNFTPDLTQSQVQAAFTAAFGYWAAVTPLTFTEVPISDGPELEIRFGTGNHGGCPFPFSGELAHNFYPPDCGGGLAGDGHYNDDFSWSVDLPPSGIDLYSVAAHEIGHGLGLAHSTVTDALMYPYYSGAHRFLHQDDIDGIQALYGASGWHNNKLIQRVFVSHHSQNCWASVQDLGWRKVEAGSPDGVTNMFISLCAARGHGIPVNVYLENDTIRIMYL